MPEGLTVLLQSFEDLAHLKPHACLIWSYFLHKSIQLLGDSCICAYYCKAGLMFAHLLDCIMSYAQDTLNLSESAVQSDQLSEAQVEHTFSSSRQNRRQHCIQEPA